MAGKILQQVLDGAAVDEPKPAEIVKKSAFAEDTDVPLTMQDIEAALVAKRAEQRASLKRMAALLQEACDILNGFDA